MRARRSHLLFWAVALVLAAQHATALINPNFTPLDMVNDADLILLLRVEPSGGGEKFPMKVVEVLKGEKPEGALTLDLSVAAQVEHAQLIRDRIRATQGVDALLFVGGDERGDDAAFLEIDRSWLRVDAEQGGVYQMDVIHSVLLGTWDGGTESLARLVRYILTDEEPDVPVAEAGAWGTRTAIGPVKGVVAHAMGVQLQARQELTLFVASDAGDRLYRWDAAKKSMADVTAVHKLASASRRAAWGDLNGDGRQDLLSFDGTKLLLWAQGADGAFPAQPRPVDAAWPGGCIGLTPLELGVKGRPGVLVSTDQLPVLLKQDVSGAFAAIPLAAPAADMLAARGNPVPCLVADFDGDARADILQPGESGSLLWKGEASGLFSAPSALSIMTRGEKGMALVADLDMDGRLDVVCSSADSIGIWQNEGKLVFQDLFMLSGEIHYTTQPGSIGGSTCDIDNDGRQDLFLVHGSLNVELYFNRGYRNMGKSLSMIWTDSELMQYSGNGQQAGMVADLNADGAQDLALVLKDGTIMVLFRDTSEEPGLAVHATLPMDGHFAGPLNATGWLGTRCLGAWNIAAGGAGAFFGTRDPGELTVKWRYPGEPEQSRTVIVENGPVDLLLAPASAGK